LLKPDGVRDGFLKEFNMRKGQGIEEAAMKRGIHCG
jgi:hypothetical protein